MRIRRPLTKVEAVIAWQRHRETLCSRDPVVKDSLCFIECKEGIQGHEGTLSEENIYHRLYYFSGVDAENWYHTLVDYDKMLLLAAKLGESKGSQMPDVYLGEPFGSIVIGTEPFLRTVMSFLLKEVMERRGEKTEAFNERVAKNLTKIPLVDLNSSLPTIIPIQVAYYRNRTWVRSDGVKEDYRSPKHWANNARLLIACIEKPGLMGL